jgi:DNA invertase Pin-like site-specific DNA recombinase
LIGYVRVSTEEQAREGLSLEAQRERLTAYCRAMGHELVGVETDAGVSGKVAPDRRPGMALALAAVERKEASGIVAVKLDRLSRSTRHVLDLVERAERKGWQLHSVGEQLDTGSACGRLIVTILGALAQMEREQVGERTRDGMAQLLREGRTRSSTVPFGWRRVVGDARRLEAEPKEQVILAEMLELRAGGLGVKAIEKRLAEMGVVNPRTSAPLRWKQIDRILCTAERRSAVLGTALASA